MPGRLELLFLGDTRDLQRAFGELDSTAGTFEDKVGRERGRLRSFARAALGGIAAGLLAAGHEARRAAAAAADSEASTARLEAQFRAQGFALRAHSADVDAVVQRTSRLAGLDDEDLQDAFTTILRATGSVSESLKQIGLVADIARAKGMDVAKAATLVAKVEGGNVGILKRYGVQIDKDASSADALAALHRKFAGQAKAYGDTTQGAYDKYQVARENLEEAIGSKLTPALTKLALAGVDLVNKVAPIVASIAGAVGDAAEWTASTANTVIGTVRDVDQAVRDGVKWTFDRIKQGATLVAVGLLPPAQAAMMTRLGVAAFRSELGGEIRKIGGHMAAGILKGLDPRQIVKFLIHALGGIKDLAGKIIGGIGGFIGGLFGGGGSGDRVDLASAAMSAIAARHLPYTYGGGHGRLGVGAPGFDCSGYVSVALGVLGAIAGPMAVREPMASALERGAGKRVTVGIRGTSGQNAHTMIKLDGKYFESGGGHGPAQVGGWDGAFEMFHPRGFAQGGSFITDRPYVFLAGEAGPERVTITPLSGRKPAVRLERPVVRSVPDALALAARAAFQVRAAACC